jgi:hypothetical protein
VNIYNHKSLGLEAKSLLNHYADFYKFSGAFGILLEADLPGSSTYFLIGLLRHQLKFGAKVWNDLYCDRLN